MLTSMRIFVVIISLLALLINPFSQVAVSAQTSSAPNPQSIGLVGNDLNDKMSSSIHRPTTDKMLYGNIPAEYHWMESVDEELMAGSELPRPNYPYEQPEISRDLNYFPPGRDYFYPITDYYKEYIPPTAEVISQTASQVKSFDCATVTEIPIDECQVLVSLYESTNGAGWSNSTNWLVTTLISDWYGVVISSNHVIEINLRNNNLTGHLPENLNNLIYLYSLDVDTNQLSGNLPINLGSISSLEKIYLSYNYLTGEIPPEWSNLSNLQRLSLSFNNLTGEIPNWIGNLFFLTGLYLTENQFTGSIPPELGNLVNLSTLYLESNLLSGPIPSELGNLSNLSYLYLSQNQLSDLIPSELGNIVNLSELNLGGNQLSGSIPSELGQLTNLAYLNLSDNLLSGPIPPEIGNLTNLSGLNLSYNQLSGQIPSELGNLNKLIVLRLEDNQLTGSIPPEFGNLIKINHLYLYNNQLSGQIPNQLMTSPYLLYLLLNDNQLTGEIPLEIGNLGSLMRLSLSNNQLSGSIPDQIGNLTSLSYLGLSNNQLSGNVPVSFTNLINICEPGMPWCWTYGLDLNYNRLTTPATPQALSDFLALKNPGWELTQAVSETIDETGGEITSNDGDTTLTFPAGSVTQETVITFVPQPGPSTETGLLSFANSSFLVEVLAAGKFDFAQPVTVSLTYADADLGSLPWLLAESNLKLYWWSGSAWVDAATTCAVPSDYVRDPTANTLQLSICKSGEFALLGVYQPMLFLPVVRR